MIGYNPASALLGIYDIGARLEGSHSWFNWSFAGLPQVSLGDETDKSNDVLAYAAFGPFGPLRFQLAWQAGEVEDLFRMRTTGRISFDMKPFSMFVLAAHERVDGADSLSFAGLLGWRAHDHLDLAAGFDGMAPAGAPLEQLFRAQATFLTLEDCFRVGTMYQYAHPADEHSAHMRFQANF